MRASMFFQSGVFVAAVVAAAVALGDDFAVPIIVPPQITQLPESFGECIAPGAPASGYDDDFSVTLTIAASGELKEFALPEGSPDWMNGPVKCVLDKLRFSPATRDADAVESIAFLGFKFGTNGAASSTGAGIERVGPLMTPPRLVRMPKGTADCFPSRFAKRGDVARFVVTLHILPDGRVTNVNLPVGSEPWQAATTQCVLERVMFLPGTRDGVAVEAQTSLPIVYRTISGQVAGPELRSSDEQIEAAYRACYPSGYSSTAAAYYRFDIAANGHVANPKLFEGSGDPRLDEAGLCILGQLEFEPLKQNGRAIRSTVTWRLPIRPPR